MEDLAVQVLSLKDELERVYRKVDRLEETVTELKHSLEEARRGARGSGGGDGNGEDGRDNGANEAHHNEYETPSQLRPPSPSESSSTSIRGKEQGPTARASCRASLAMKLDKLAVDAAALKEMMASFQASCQVRTSPRRAAASTLFGRHNNRVQRSGHFDQHEGEHIAGDERARSASGPSAKRVSPWLQTLHDPAYRAGAASG